MTSFLLAVLALAQGPTPSVPAPRGRLFEYGRSSARGALINLTQGCGRQDPFDPSRPTVVAIHGLNPFHPFLHATAAERYAEAIGARYGSSVNVLGWDWNAGTLRNLSPRRNAVDQGRALAEALRGRGVLSDRLHLVGMSSGCIVAASAARSLADAGGRPIARLSLVDPARPDHPTVFDALAPGSAASFVEHLWADSPSGFGKPAAAPGVIDERIPARKGLAGYLRPRDLDHLNAVREHVDRMRR